jgi:hypothetical protein
MWTIIASICGTIVGTVSVACFGTLKDRAGSRRAEARTPRKAGV